MRAEWDEDFDNPVYATFVAVVDGRVVGSAVGCSVTVSGSNKGILRPDDAGFLGFAAVLPEARGAGIGKVLGNDRARLGRGRGLQRRRHRLAGDEPALVAHLAATRLAADVLPPSSRDRLRRRPWTRLRWPDRSWMVVCPHPSPLGLSHAARHGRRRRDPAAATAAARPVAGHCGGGRRGAPLSALRATPRRSRHAWRPGRDRRRASLAAAPGRADRSAPAGGRGRDRPARPARDAGGEAHDPDRRRPRAAGGPERGRRSAPPDSGAGLPRSGRDSRRDERRPPPPRALRRRAGAHPRRAARRRPRRLRHRRRDVGARLAPARYSARAPPRRSHRSARRRRCSRRRSPPPAGSPGGSRPRSARTRR